MTIHTKHLNVGDTIYLRGYMNTPLVIKAMSTHPGEDILVTIEYEDTDFMGGNNIFKEDGRWCGNDHIDGKDGLDIMMVQSFMTIDKSSRYIKWSKKHG